MNESTPPAPTDRDPSDLSASTDLGAPVVRRPRSSGPSGTRPRPRYRAARSRVAAAVLAVGATGGLIGWLGGGATANHSTTQTDATQTDDASAWTSDSTDTDTTDGGTTDTTDSGSTDTTDSDTTDTTDRWGGSGATAGRGSSDSGSSDSSAGASTSTHGS